MTKIILKHATLATMQPDAEPYGLVLDGAIAIEHGHIAWYGASNAVPQDYSEWDIRDLKGALVTPAMIDCHTHIVHAGNRAAEFELRLNGATYEEIARAGGGINATVKATRRASEEALLQDALVRVDALLSEGVSCIEVKSGYGLDHGTELKMLRVARRIGEIRPVRIRTSFLGAHAVPPEYKNRPDEYLDEICLPALEAAHAEGLVDAVDGFCETIGFSPAQITKLFEKARTLGLPVKLHAEQLSLQGGSALAASYGALSADHLEYLDPAGIQAMSRAGTTAVLLPAAYYFLRDTHLPPIQDLRNAKVPMAVATDCNPGSSPMMSLLLAMNMACTLFRLTPEEALRGTTSNAAKALGLSDTGMISQGYRADVSIWDAEHPAELSYYFGRNPLRERLFGAS